MTEKLTDRELELKERMEVLLLEMFCALVDEDAEGDVNVHVSFMGQRTIFALIDVPDNNRALCNGKEGQNVKAAVRFAGRLAKKYDKFLQLEIERG